MVDVIVVLVVVVVAVNIVDRGKIIGGKFEGFEHKHTLFFVLHIFGVIYYSYHIIIIHVILFARIVQCFVDIYYTPYTR